MSGKTRDERANDLFLQPLAGSPTEEGQLRNTGSDIEAYVGGSAKSLTAAAGGGITEGQHEGLDRLTHRVNETSYEEYIYTGNQLTGWILWDSASKTTKIREEQYTRTGNKVTNYVEIQYDAAGVEKERNTLSSWNYTGNRLDNLTRTHA